MYFLSQAMGALRAHLRVKGMYIIEMFFNSTWNCIILYFDLLEGILRLIMIFRGNIQEYETVMISYIKYVYYVQA